MDVAVLGLGIIGSAMAARLLAAGHSVTVWNRSPAKAAPLVAAGARQASSPAEATRQAAITLAALGDDAGSRDVWLGRAGVPGGLLAAPPSAVLVECSTLSLAWVRELAAHAREHGRRFLDAPVTGTRAAAEAGTLTLLVGGAPEDLAAARPVFEAIGRELLHFGPVGSGTLFKLVNNLQSAIQIVALAEGLRLAEGAGLDLGLVVRALSGGRPGSPVVRDKAPRIAARDYDEVQFALRWMLKDVEYALRAAVELGLDLPALGAARAVFARALDEGLGAKDVSAVAESYR